MADSDWRCVPYTTPRSATSSVRIIAIGFLTGQGETSAFRDVGGQTGLVWVAVHRRTKPFSGRNAGNAQSVPANASRFVMAWSRRAETGGYAIPAVRLNCKS